MTRSQFVALVLGLVIVLAGGGAWWRSSDRTLPPTLAERLGEPASRTASNGTASDRSVDSAGPVAPKSSETASLAPQPIPPQPKQTPSPTAVPEPGNPTIAPAPPARAASPSFDIVRVEPRGDAVVAGKSAPNANISLMAGSKVLGEAKSDANGQFVILPPPLKPGDYDLTLRQAPEGKPAATSAQSVAVSVPHAGKGSVVVALAEPGKATKLLSRQPEPEAPSPAAAAPLPPDKVSIRSVELENGTGFYASGTAPPKANIQVYLNNAHIADVTAGADGAWSVRVRKGLTGGHYVVRADIGDGARVASRAEVPFDVPLEMAAAPPPEVAAALQEAQAAAASPSQTAPPTPPAGPAPTAPAPPAPPTPSPAKVASESAPAPPVATSPASTHPAAPAQAPPKPAPDKMASVSQPPPAPPAAASQTVANAPQSAGTPAVASADVTVDSVATARVTTGDNLWNISRSHLGYGKRYTQIYAANASQIRDPNLIYPGQVFVVPKP